MNESIIPVITLLGQKNTGKSTLFNKLIRKNSALISHNNLGFTRDRQYGFVQYKKNTFIIVDTGGFNRLCMNPIQNYINNQAILAIQESCIILLILNGQLQLSSVDYDTIKFIRKLNKTIFIVVNKIDNIIQNNSVKYNYSALGMQNVILVSAMHGYGISNLLKQILSVILDQSYCHNKYQICEIKRNNKKSSTKKLYIKLAVIGRPNSGKSTFINYVLKKNRMITSEIPGTTRDSIYIPAIYNNQRYILIDTAGVRKKNHMSNATEYLSVLKTFQVLKDANVILFMIDINEGLVDQDLALLSAIINKIQALIIVINKWDIKKSLTQYNDIKYELINKANSFNYARIHCISSLCGYGIKKLFQSIVEIYQLSIQTINTAQLVRIMRQAVIKYPPPFLLGTRVAPRLKYVHIGGYRPITIIVHGTQVSKLSMEYQRYLKQYFCQSLDIQGIGTNFQFKDNKNPFKKV